MYIEFLSIYFIIIYLTIIVSQKFNFYDFPNKRKIHSHKILNTSGLALYIYILYLIFRLDLSLSFTKIIYAGLVVVLTGLIDDKRGLSPNIKLLLISIPTIYLATNGYNVTDLGVYEKIGKISLGQFYLIFTLFAVGLLTNSYNYIDGVDGLLITSLLISITYLSILIQDSSVINLFFYISIALLINLILNFLPHQNKFKIFSGNSGSLFSGFFISFLIIYFYKYYNIHPSYLIWSCWLPVYDFLYVTFVRIIKKKQFYIADKNHFHHMIFKILNKSHFKTVLFIGFVNISVIIFAYQICKNFGNLFSLILFIILFKIFCMIRYLLTKYMQNNKI